MRLRGLQILAASSVALALGAFGAVAPSSSDLAAHASTVIAPPAPVIPPSSTTTYTDADGNTKSTILTKKGVGGGLLLGTVANLNALAPDLDLPQIVLQPLGGVDGFEQHCIDALGSTDLFGNSTSLVFPWCLGVYNSYGGIDAFEAIFGPDAVAALGTAEPSTGFLPGAQIAAGTHLTAACHGPGADGHHLFTNATCENFYSVLSVTHTGSVISTVYDTTSSATVVLGRTAPGVFGSTSVPLSLSCFDPAFPPGPTNWSSSAVESVSIRDGQELTRTLTCASGRVIGHIGFNISGASWSYLSTTPRPGWHANIGFYEPVAADTAVGTMTATARCTDGTNVSDVVVSTPLTITPLVPVQVPEVECPPGWISTGVGIEFQPPSGAPSELVPFTPRELTPLEEDMMNTQPGCLTAQTACTLGLWRLVNGNWQYCGEYGQWCPDWVRDPGVVSNYQCRYGSSVLDLHYCSAFRAPELGILPNVDANGNPIPYNAPKPVLPPGPPVSGGGDLRQQCEERQPPSFFEALSPWWILETVKCALIEVFVPRTSVVQATRYALAVRVDESVIGAAQDLVPTIAGVFEAASASCTGPAFEVTIDLEAGGGMSETYYPLDACDAPMSGLAVLVKTIASGLLILAGLFAVLRYLATIFGFIGPGGGPVFRSRSSESSE